jgi:CcmD family protein
MQKILNLITLLLISISTFAQDASNDIEMADVMRSNGKIYIVVAVLAIIFAGIVVYLINLDRKISKIEKRIKKED